MRRKLCSMVRAMLKFPLRKQRTERLTQNNNRKYVERLGIKSVGNLDNFQEIKYNNIAWEGLQREYNLKKHYDMVLEQGLISKLVDFDTYKFIDQQIQKELYNIKTVNNIVIKSHSYHFIDRVIGHIFDVPKDRARNGVAICDVKNTLLAYKNVIQKEKSVVIVGKKCKVSISLVNEGSLVQTNPVKDKEKR